MKTLAIVFALITTTVMAGTGTNWSEPTEYPDIVKMLSAPPTGKCRPRPDSFVGFWYQGVPEASFVDHDGMMTIFPGYDLKTGKKIKAYPGEETKFNNWVKKVQEIDEAWSVSEGEKQNALLEAERSYIRNETLGSETLK
jgi:hypothetical protein